MFSCHCEASPAARISSSCAFCELHARRRHRRHHHHQLCRGRHKLSSVGCHALLNLQVFLLLASSPIGLIIVITITIIVARHDRRKRNRNRNRDVYSLSSGDDAVQAAKLSCPPLAAAATSCCALCNLPHESVMLLD